MQHATQFLFKGNSFNKAINMKFSIMKIMHITAIAFGIAGAAHGLAQTAVPSTQSQSNIANKPTGFQYNFKYTSSDARFNVFDDGDNTRILMPEGSLIPVITTIKPSGEVLLTPRIDGTALVLSGIHSGLKLMWANGRAVSIQYQGPSETKRLGQAAAFGAVTAQTHFQSLPTPVKTSIEQDEKTKASIAVALGENKRVEMLDRDLIRANKTSNVVNSQGNLAPQSAITSADPANQQSEPTSQKNVLDMPVISTVPEKSAGTDATSAPKAQPQSPLKAAPALPLPPEPGQVLSISRGDYLSQALESWLKPRGYHLVWDVPARGDLVRDIELTAPWTASTADLDTALSELLVPFGLRAIVQTKSRTIVVRAAAGSALQRSTPTAPAGATK